METPNERPWHNFEEEVFRAVKRALRVNYFPSFDGRIEVRRNSEYRGQSGNPIKLEIGVDLYRKDASEPYLIWLWECKHKSRRKVEVGDIYQLAAKVLDIGISRAKGSMVTTIGFEDGAIKQAETHGITLCLLRKKLVYVSKYARDQEDEEREVIYVESGFDFGGKSALLPEFEAFVRHCIRQI